MAHDTELPRIRLGSTDLALYKRQAVAEGVTFSSWVRGALGRAASGEAEIPERSPVELGEALGEVLEETQEDLVARARGLLEEAGYTAPLSGRERQAVVASARDLLAGGKLAPEVIKTLLGRWAEHEGEVRGIVEKLEDG